MKKFRLIITLLVVVTLVSTTLAQDLQFAKTLHRDWSFIENKGQLADENGKLLPDIKYYGRDKGVNIYCRQQMLSFVFTKTTFKDKANASNEIPSKFDEPEIDKVDYERMDMIFVGSNANAPILTSGQKETYLNYYLAHTPEQGITNVHQFEKLTYKNIYNQIDLVIYVKEQGIKYEFIIHPAGKVSDVKIKWEGTTPELLSNGSIKYLNHLGFIEESAPFSFLTSGEKVESNFYKNHDGSISFKTGYYHEHNTLTIDPNLSWGTYFGGSDDDIINDISIDIAGKVISTGSSFSTSGIATSGAYQTSLAGSNDGIIAKFASNGNIQWATYYGGSRDDELSGITIDTAGNIYITGNTRSSSGIATSGAFQTSFSGTGVSDALIAKFTSGGNRIWGSYFGGTSNDRGHSISLDNSGDIVMLGMTGSSGLATTGAYQTSPGGAAYDIFITKFNNSGSRLWATYYGGSDNETGGVVKIDTSGNIIIGGITYSTSGIATSGAYQTSNAGGTNDGFLAKFNTNGSSLIWGTYFGGTSRDNITGITVDLPGNIYLTGFTDSPSGIATSGAYQSTNAGKTDAMIAKFNSGGNIQWATYYGGSDVDNGYDIDFNKNGYLYISGKTTSSNGMATTGAYQTTYSGGGGEDAFLCKFTTGGSRIWGTYFGGSGRELVIKVATDSTNVIISGASSSTSGIASSGTHQTSFGGGPYDGFIAKFKDCLMTDSTIIKTVCDSFVLNKITYKTSGTYTQTLTNAVKCDSIITLKLTVKKTFATLIKTSCDSFVYYGTTYKTSGTFTQKIANKAGCDSVVTLKLLIKVSSDTILTIASCNNYTLNAVTYNTSGTYMQKITNLRGCDSLITLNLTITKPTDTTLNATACNSYVLNGQTYSSSGNYTQTLTNKANCDSTITLNLTIEESTAFTLTKKDCNSISLNGTTYNSSGTFIQALTNKAGCDSTLTLKLTINKSTSSTINQTACDQFVLNGTTYNKGGTYTQTLTNKKGCDSTITLNLTINQNPEAYFSATVNKNKVTFTPKDMNAKNYAWEFGDGGTSTQKSPVYTYPSIANYTVKLKITSNEDCTNEHDTTISIQSVGDIAKNIKTGITLFPNPTKSEVYISGLTEPALIKLMDATGKLIAEMESSKISKLNTMDLSKGIYLINISNEQMNQTKKLVIE